MSRSTNENQQLVRTGVVSQQRPIQREKDYYHEPVPGVIAHTHEIERASANQYQHAQKTEFAGQDGTRGVATETVKVSVQRSGGGGSVVGGSSNAALLASSITNGSSNSGSSGTVTISESSSTTESKTTKTIATVVGHVEQDVLVVNTNAHQHSSTADHLAERISEAKHEQYREEKFVSQHETTTRTNVARQNSGPHVRNVTVNQHVGQQADASYRDVTSEMAAPPYVVEKRGSSTQMASYKSGTSDLAVGPYVVESGENYHMADVSYADTTRDMAAGPYIVESRPQPLTQIDASFRQPARDIPGPYVVESHNIQTVTHTKTSDIAAGPYIVENTVRQSYADARSGTPTSDIASGPYEVESKGRSSGVMSERIATSDIAVGPYISEKQGYSTFVDARSGEAVSDIASGPYVVESRTTSVRTDARSGQATSDVAVGPYIVENHPLPSAGLLNEQVKTRDVAQGPYIVESRTHTNVNVDARSGESVRDVAAGPYVVESRGQPSGALSERMVTSDIAAPPYVLVSEGQQRQYDASAFDQQQDVFVAGGIAAKTAQKFEQGIQDLHTVHKTQVDLVRHNIGEKIDTFEHGQQRPEVVKKQVSVFGDVAGTIEKLREETTVVEKTQVPKLRSDVYEKAEFFETQRESSPTKQPVVLEKHADIQTIKQELAHQHEHIERTPTPQLNTHVRERAEIIEHTREQPIVSQPVEIVKRASVTQVIHELQQPHSIRTTPAPIVDVSIQDRAEQLLDSASKTVEVHKEVVVNRHVDDIKSQLLSEHTSVQHTVAPDLHTNVQGRAQQLIESTHRHAPSPQREVSVRGDVVAVIDRMEHLEDAHRHRTHHEIEARGHVRENRELFESGQITEMQHVTMSQPVEIAQVEVKRVERGAALMTDGDQLASNVSSSGNLSPERQNKMIVDETVTVRVNRELEGKRVVPESVIIETTEQTRMIETTTTTNTSSSASSHMAAISGGGQQQQQQQLHINNRNDGRITEINSTEEMRTAESGAHHHSHHHHHHHHHKQEHHAQQQSSHAASMHSSSSSSRSSESSASSSAIKTANVSTTAGNTAGGQVVEKFEQLVMTTTKQQTPQ